MKCNSHEPILDTLLAAHNRKMTKYAIAQLVSFGPPINEERSVHVGFVVEKVAKEHVFLRVLRFSPISIIQQWSTVIQLSPMLYNLSM